MTHLTCEFCNSRIGPILPHDMGEDRVMHLCGRCRNYLDDGKRSPHVVLQIDAKTLAKAVMPELLGVIRNSTGRRNF